MINEYKLMEYMRKYHYIIFLDNEEHSIQGIIERFKEV